MQIILSENTDNTASDLSKRLSAGGYSDDIAATFYTRNLFFFDLQTRGAISAQNFRFAADAFLRQFMQIPRFAPYINPFYSTLSSNFTDQCRLISQDNLFLGLNNMLSHGINFGGTGGYFPMRQAEEWQRDFWAYWQARNKKQWALTTNEFLQLSFCNDALLILGERQAAFFAFATYD